MIPAFGRFPFGTARNLLSSKAKWREARCVHFPLDRADHPFLSAILNYGDRPFLPAFLDCTDCPFLKDKE
jgi:hypothetical protein